jgi:hypothetical protein
MCQNVCPINRSLPLSDISLQLDEGETREFLASDTEPMGADLEAKLRAFMSNDRQIPVLGRNARLVLENL